MAPRTETTSPGLGSLGLLLAGLLLVLGLVGCRGEPTEVPGDQVLVTATVEGVGYGGHDFWLVVAGSVEDFHRDRFLASTLVEHEGLISTVVPTPAPELWVWLVQDLEGDGPSSGDPGFQYCLTPLQGEAGEPVHVTLSGAHEVFFDPTAPEAWVRWQGDAAAAHAVQGVLQLGLLALLALTIWSRSHPAAPHPRWREGATATSRGVVLLGSILVFALGLRLLVWTIPGCGSLGLTEAPWLPFLFPEPGAPSLWSLLVDPYYLVSRHQLAFGLLLRLLGSISPAGLCGVELVLILASLGVVVLVYQTTRSLGGSTAALVAAGLAASSPLAIHFAGGISPHGFHLLLVCLSQLFFLRGLLIDHGPSRLLWAVSSVLGVYVFPFHAAYLGAQVLVALGLSLRPRRWRAWIGASTVTVRWGLLALLLAITPILPPLVFLRVALFGFRELSIFDQIAQTLELLAGLPAGWVALSPLVFSLGVIGLIALWRKSGVACAVLIFPPVCFVAIYGVVMLGTLFVTDAVHWYTGHWALGLLAFGSPLLGMGTVELLALASRLRRRGGGALVGAVALVVVAFAPLGWQPCTVGWMVVHHGVPDVQAAAGIVAERYRPGDALVVSTGHPHLGLVASALSREGVAGLVSGSDIDALSLGSGMPLDLESPEPSTGRVWVFAPAEERFGRPKIDHARLDAWRSASLARNFEIAQRWELPYLELRLLERAGPAPSSESD